MEPSPPRYANRSLSDVLRWADRDGSSVPCPASEQRPQHRNAQDSKAHQPSKTGHRPKTQHRSKIRNPPETSGSSVALDIWQRHFELAGDPFSLTPDPEFLYPSPSHAEALAALKLGLWERRGLTVMIGEVGTGKTTLVYSLLSRLDPEIETAYLSSTLLTFDEILVTALDDFGVACPSRRRLDLHQALNEFLRSCADVGKTAVLVIDEAQNLSDDVFERLRLLLNYETYTTKLLQILLVGQPELNDRLRQPNLRQIGDRVAVRSNLAALSRSEARSYIGHRLTTAGGSLDLFTWAALSLLIRKSRGIPRRINILAHNALLFAYGRELRQVDRSTMQQAVRELQGL